MSERKEFIQMLNEMQSICEDATDCDKCLLGNEKGECILECSGDIPRDWEIESEE
ncbi:MAG: hypothetical protein Q4D45_10325 [Lachnospiraceae bacterium]|nr:hypothetical protein [Lachnospiraceae bacterium]